MLCVSGGSRGACKCSWRAQAMLAFAAKRGLVLLAAVHQRTVCGVCTPFGQLQPCLSAYCVSWRWQLAPASTPGIPRGCWPLSGIVWHAGHILGCVGGHSCAYMATAGCSTQQGLLVATHTGGAMPAEQPASTPAMPSWWHSRIKMHPVGPTTTLDCMQKPLLCQHGN